MLKAQLLELGFTPNQAEVYLALIPLGQTRVGLLLKKTGFHRNIVYRALDELRGRKLIYQSMHRGIIHVEISDPTPLIHELEQRQALARLVIKELKTRQQIMHLETGVRDGFQGIKQLTDHVLLQGEDLYVWGENGQLSKRYAQHFRTFQHQRIAKRIHIHYLAQPRSRNWVFIKNLLTETSFLPYPIAPSLVLWVYGHSVAHILTETPEVVYVVNNKKIADGLRDYFTLLRHDNLRPSKNKKSIKFM